MKYASDVFFCALFTSNITTVFTAMEPLKSKLFNMLFAADFCQSDGVTLYGTDNSVREKIIIIGGIQKVVKYVSRLCRLYSVY